MARADPNDMIMQVANLLKPNDSSLLKTILHDCHPYKRKNVVTKIGMKKELKEGAEKDPLTGKYYDNDYEEVEGEVQEETWVVPAHTLWLARHFGNPGCCNERMGCECLAEPDDDGNQPEWNSPC